MRTEFIGAQTRDVGHTRTLTRGGDRAVHGVAAEALQPVETAATLRIRQGQVSVTDGPFAETKEHLAGFYLIEAADLNEAIQTASKIPPAREGSVEIRPVRQLEP